MAPSAPLPLPPPMPTPAFVNDDQLGQHSNGHTLGSAVKVPGKSNLKQSSSLPSTSHPGNGSSTLEDKDARLGDTHEVGGEHDHGGGYRGLCKVQWIDNYGKDLTQVFEFEPSSDSGDSDDDDDDCESSQACTCVIQ